MKHMSMAEHCVCLLQKQYSCIDDYGDFVYIGCNIIIVTACCLSR